MQELMGNTKELMGNAANAATQKRLECRRSPTKRQTLPDWTGGEFVLLLTLTLTEVFSCFWRHYFDWDSCL